MRVLSSGIAAVAAALAVAGCGAGSGEPDRIGQITSYDAAIAAREALNDAALDPASIAYGKSLLVDEIHSSEASTGEPAWRVSFMDAAEQPSDVCVWVWEDEEARRRPSVFFEVERCPADAAA